MEGSSDYINDIKKKIMAHTGMNEIELQREIEAVVNELEFLSPEAAVMQIARKHGIETEEIGSLESHEFSAPILTIADIIEHEIVQPSISVQGIVLRVYRPLKIKSRLNPTESDVLVRILLGDGTGSLMVLLWPPHSGMVLNGTIARGEPVRLRRVSSKRNPRSNVIEIHTNASSEIEIVSELLNDETFPHPHELIHLPSDLIRKVNEEGPINRLTEFDVLGRVAANYGVRTFTKANQQTGQYGQILIRDQETSVRVLFWEERSEDIHALNVGDVVLLEGVTISVNLQQRAPSLQEGTSITVHVNKLANVSKLDESFLDNIPQGNTLKTLTFQGNESKVLEKNQNLQDSMPTTLSELGFYQKNVQLLVRVKKILSSRSFVRNDGSNGHVTRALVHDGRVGVFLVAWDDKGKFLESCSENDILNIQGAQSRPSRKGDLLEVHVDNNGQVNRVRTEEMEEGEQKRPSSFLQTISWDELATQGGKFVSVRGIVYNIFEEHVFERSGGLGQGKNQVFLISDENDNHRARVVLWNEKVDELSEIINQLQVGTVVEITWTKVKIDERYGGTINLHLSPESKIIIVGERSETVTNVKAQSTRDVSRSVRPRGETASVSHELNGIIKGQTVECRAVITEIASQRPYYLSCPRDDCQKKLTKSESDMSSSTYTCPVHGIVSHPEVKIVISGRIDDGTAQHAFVTFGKVSEMLLSDELIARLHQIVDPKAEEPDSAAISQWLQDVKDFVLGRQFVLRGYVVESRQKKLDNNFNESMNLEKSENWQVILTWISPVNAEERFELLAQKLI